MGTQGDGGTASRITSWHAAVFFQVFALMIYVLLPVWYAVVMISPGSVSEYLPHENPATLATISEAGAFSAIWALLLYFTLKKRKIALLGSVVYCVFWLIILPIAFATGVLLPDFSDFVFLPTAILLAIFSAMAYRSFPKGTR